MGHWLADPVKTGQAVYLEDFAPALAALIFDSLCRCATANAPATNGHDQREQTAKYQ